MCIRDSSITTALADVRTRVVQAGNGTFADSDRQALSTALKNARDALLGLANSTDGNGQYLFSGFQGGVVPYAQDTTGKIVYSGATGERTVQVDQSRQMSTSDIGLSLIHLFHLQQGRRDDQRRHGEPVVRDARRRHHACLLYTSRCV